MKTTDPDSALEKEAFSCYNKPIGLLHESRPNPHTAELNSMLKQEQVQNNTAFCFNQIYV